MLSSISGDKASLRRLPASDEDTGWLIFENGSTEDKFAWTEAIISMVPIFCMDVDLLSSEDESVSSVSTE